jgi:hypothetical protein
MATAAKSKSKSAAKSGEKAPKKGKKFSVEVVSPKAIAAYAWVNKPDTGNQYSDDKYKVTLVFDGEADLSKLEAAAKEVADHDFPDVKFDDVKLPFVDGDTKAEKNEEFAGKVLVTAKSQFKPGVFDAKRKALPKGIELRSGDVCKALLKAISYEKTETVVEKVNGKRVESKETVHGITFQLAGLQLLEKRNGGGNAANAFEDEEGGFDASEYEGAGSDDSSSGDGDQSGDY